MSSYKKKSKKNVAPCKISNCPYYSFKGEEKFGLINKIYFDTIFFTSPIPQMMCNLDGIIIKANDPFCKLLGYKIEELLKMSVYELAHREDVEATRKHLELYRKKLKTTNEYKKNIIRKNGEYVPVTVRTILVPDESGQKFLVLAHIQERSQDQYSQDAVDECLSDIYEKLKKISFNSVNTFISGICHEIKSALQVLKDSAFIVNAIAQMTHENSKCHPANLNNDSLIMEMNDQLNIATKAINSIDDLLDNISTFGGLSLFKDETQQSFLQSITLDIKSVNIYSIIKETIDLFKCTIEYKKTPILIYMSDCNTDNMHVSGGILKQILMNLLTNAYKSVIEYHKNNINNAAIIIRSKKEIEKINKLVTFIEVEDNGRGIPPLYKEKLFTPFYRVYRDMPGSGLGLFFCKTAAMNANMNLFLKCSEEGKTVFRLEFTDTDPQKSEKDTQKEVRIRTGLNE